MRDVLDAPLKRRWYPCDCSECECEVPIRSGEICDACQQNFHIAPEDEDV